MTSEQLEAFIRSATPEQVELWLALVRLFQALDKVGQPMRDAALQAILYVCKGKEDLSVWEEAIGDWE